MVNNNELLLGEEQQKKKKLYKNWKLYASALGIIVIGLGVGLGIGLGIKHNSTTTPITLINLNNLNLKKDISQTVDTQEKAFNLFIQENLTEYPDLANYIEAGTFTSSDYAVFGSLVINAKANSKYSGTILINFLKLTQNPIDNNLLNKTITGTEVIQNDETGQEAFKAFLDKNNSWTNLSDFVDYSSFVKPTFTTNGSLIITAKENTPYYGSLTVTITKLQTKKLSELNLNTTISGITSTTDEQFFQLFLETNKNILESNLTLDQVELTNFNGIKIGQNGTLTITVKEDINNKYTGTIDITLKYRLDAYTLIDMMYYLSKNNLLNFEIPVGTKTADLMKIVTQQFRDKLSNYYVYADGIQSIDATSPNYFPNQNQLNTAGTVWTPPKNSTIDGIKVSSLWIGFTLTHTDGTIETPITNPSENETSYLTAYNLTCTITVV